MKRLLVVFHSLTGGSAQMAGAAATAARAVEAVETALRPAADAAIEELLAADGFIFVCPENLAAISGVMKDFFDRTYYPLLGQAEGRPYATMICAGSDGQNAARQIARIATGWRLRPVAAPLIICTHAQTPEQILAPKVIAAADLARCAELGATLAAGLAMGIF